VAFLDLVAAADRAAQDHLGGVAVTYEPEGGVAVEVTGIFDAAHVLPATQGRAEIEQVGPVLWVRLEDLPVDPDIDEPTITIAGTDYKIRERQRDGAGSIRLLLHRVS